MPILLENAIWKMLMCQNNEMCILEYANWKKKIK